MLKVVLPLALLAAACAPRPAPARAPESLEAAQDAEVASDSGFNWYLGEAGGVVSLSYMIAETDNVPMDLECTVGSGRVKVSVMAISTAPRIIRLRAGEESVGLKARTEPDPTSDESLFLTAELPAAEPVLQRFRDQGRIELEVGLDAGPLVATRDGPRRVKAFFDRCGSGLRGRL